MSLRIQKESYEYLCKFLKMHNSKCLGFKIGLHKYMNIYELSHKNVFYKRIMVCYYRIGFIIPSVGIENINLMY